jgi:hypothetical protein
MIEASGTITRAAISDVQRSAILYRLLGMTPYRENDRQFSCMPVRRVSRCSKSRTARRSAGGDADHLALSVAGGSYGLKSELEAHGVSVPPSRRRSLHLFPDFDGHRLQPDAPE